MSVDAIAAVNTISLEPSALTNAPQGNFTAWFDNQMTTVNQQLAVADQGMQKLAMGDASNLHQVMIQMEEAKLSVQLVLQVRNRLLEAYQDVMRMQM
ncbi:flagellar hook-basal body complex protein FliE [Chitinimonas sp. BJB300]|uniref:flagellar hook-basal body complex protein FliE n=1 Tax=Chitinimonas sp. BJB300 TaxID=1559339 RepID=UPI000C0DDDC4|nr:flagellar hook-basal body complex protein FliE [Chitinimonas sp. BJB300]PHV12876.1 flagellar hook-basal body complex protein FliE [Chitinimonas sp. BJB300]TSJ86092.1 flagellar hook-basal body complex protein FliE [Chitinimonas sp. BJB300]